METLATNRRIECPWSAYITPFPDEYIIANWNFAQTTCTNYGRFVSKQNGRYETQRGPGVKLPDDVINGFSSLCSGHNLLSDVNHMWGVRLCIEKYNDDLARKEIIQSMHTKLKDVLFNECAKIDEEKSKLAEEKVKLDAIANENTVQAKLNEKQVELLKNERKEIKAIKKQLAVEFVKLAEERSKLKDTASKNNEKQAELFNPEHKEFNSEIAKELEIEKKQIAKDRKQLADERKTLDEYKKLVMRGMEHIAAIQVIAWKLSQSDNVGEQPRDEPPETD